MMAAEAWRRLLDGDERFAEVERSDEGPALVLSRGAARVLICEAEHAARALDQVEAAVRGEQGLLVLGSLPRGFETVVSKGGALGWLPEEPAPEMFRLAVFGLLERVRLEHQARANEQSLGRFRYERGELVEIARAMTKEREIDSLLGLILERCRYITGADAGSLYVVEDREGGGTQLRFKLSQNDSLKFESSEFVVPVSNRSIAGAAVVGRAPINIADVGQIGSDVPYTIDRSFDERVGYRTVSMLTMPMISAQGRAIGVIQLINKKRNPRAKLAGRKDFDVNVMEFDAHSEALATTIAAQAGIALENALLYDEIRRIFEGFVRASVQAIEQRDPTTSGHSLRVSVLSCALAEVVDKVDVGPYKDAHFTKRDVQELQYASLLHDFGKIGVREQVLVKAKKLYPHQRDAIRDRVDFALRGAEAAALREKLALMQQGAAGADLLRIDELFEAQKAALQDAWTVIESANEPTVLKEGDFSRIRQIAAIDYVGIDGEPKKLLSEDEVVALCITRGSLSPSEMAEIQSHVTHTYNFLAKIPWGKSMAQVPHIAGAHHEKLNGTGYPHGVGADQIPLQSKIMTIADIYDALTARDRPYKKALAADRALQILGFEVKDGNLDGELVRIFAEAKVFDAAAPDLKY
jgi:HD-GYP domain-containing protein (c-di-GMP phosphodiesterase class II)